MAYVATRGGERAIEQSERLFSRGNGRDHAKPSDRNPHGDALSCGPCHGANPRCMTRILPPLALAQTGGELYEAAAAVRGRGVRLSRV